MDLLVCRSCLAVDVKLFVIENQLSTAFQNILGKEISLNGIQYVCSLCATLLIKFMKFREQCVTAEKLSQDVVENNDLITKKCLEDIQPSLKKCYELVETEIYTNDFVPADSELIEIIDNDNANNENNDFDTIYISDDDRDDENDKKLIEFTNYIIFNPNNFEIDKKINEIATNNVIVKNEIDTESETQSHGIKAKGQTKTLKTKSLNSTKIDDKKRSIYGIGDDKENFEKTYDFNIVELSKNEQIADFYMRKTSRSYLHANYKCDLCYKGFSTEALYRNHFIVRHESTFKFLCDVCNIRYKFSSSLERHSSSHRLRFRCKKCNYVANSSDRARRHYKSHAVHNYTCKYCFGSFRIPSTYFRHIRTVHTAMLPSCSVCGVVFVGKAGLRLHVTRSHPEVVQDKCELCNFEFQTKEALSMHISKRVNEQCATDLSPCEHCGDNFANIDLLKEHFDEVHKQHIETTSYPCAQCKINFSDTRSLEKHYKTMHLKVEPRKRRDSHSKDATNDADSDNEMQSYNELCEVCGKICTYKSNLRYHKALHSGIKSFKCEMCPKSFLTALRLKLHSSVHTGIRPSKCDVCRKGFHTWSNMKRHRLLHTGELPYPCKICGKCFRQPTNLKRHILNVHTNVEPKPRGRRRKKKQDNEDC